MNKFLKAGVLLIILAIPVFVFLFLKSFGVNHYQVPLYYTADTTVSFPDCPDLNLPHQVKFQENSDHSFIIRDSYLVFAMVDAIQPGQESSEKVGQLARLTNAVPDDSYQVITFTNIDPDKFKSTFEGIYHSSDQWHLKNVNENVLQNFSRCGLLLPKEQTNFSNNLFVLVDPDGMIRGYYQGTSREEIDRLVLELKILIREREID